MKISTFMIINAVVGAVYGVAFVLVPGQVFSIFGVEASAILKSTGQMLGAYAVGIAVLTWSARKSNDSSARRAIVLGFVIGNAVGFVVTLIGQLNNVIGALGWSTVAIYLLLALGFGYFQFAKPAPEEAPSFGE